MVNLKQISATLLASVLLLSGCQTKTYTEVYTKSSTLEITSETGELVTIPYEEKMTILSKNNIMSAGIDEVKYKMTDEYFKEHSDEKKTLHKNLSNGVKGAYTDANPDAVKIKTRVGGEGQDELYVKISVNIEELTSYGDVIALFGLTSENFNDKGQVTTEVVTKYLTSSGFVKQKNENK